MKEISYILVEGKILRVAEMLENIQFKAFESIKMCINEIVWQKCIIYLI
jgi:hypothetical protein